MIHHALRLAAAGFEVFPLFQLGKNPVHTAWPGVASSDPTTVRRLWDSAAHANVALHMKGYVGVDVDVKSANGFLAVAGLEAKGQDFPPTYTQFTPTGGQHWVYRVTSRARNTVGKLAPGLDTRGERGYLVGSGSVVPAGTYTDNGAPIAPAPAWLEEWARAQEPEPTEGAPATAAGAARALEAVLTAPPGQEGSRNHQAFKLACLAGDLGLDEASTLRLLTEWKCDPPLSQQELWLLVRSSQKNRKFALGSALPQAQFQPVSTPAELAPPADFVSRLNQDYAHVVMGGQGSILWETKDESGDAVVRYLQLDAFHQRHAADTILKGEKLVPATKAWMNHPQRRSYDGVCFAPEGASPRYFNLWRGFRPGNGHPGSQQAKDSLAAFCQHALDNVCRGDAALYRRVIGWFAHIIQRPGVKPLVALVFRGEKGVGKNALVDRVGWLLAQHYLLASNRRYLVGNFNSHLEQALLLALDEAFWSGDKQAEGILKDLITGTSHIIERKGCEPYKVQNLTRVCIMGNESWLVPASWDERRFLVLDVGAGKKQDRQFFEDMRLGMEAGGYRLLFDYLRTFDLTGVDVNEPGKPTAALQDQKVASLDVFPSWWLGCLEAGSLVAGDAEGWPAAVDKERFRAAFRRHARELNVRSRLPDGAVLGRQFALVCPGATSGRREGRPVYHLPPLEEARKQWETFIGSEVDWQ